MSDKSSFAEDLTVLVKSMACHELVDLAEELIFAERAENVGHRTPGRSVDPVGLVWVVSDCKVLAVVSDVVARHVGATRYVACCLGMRTPASKWFVEVNGAHWGVCLLYRGDAHRPYNARNTEHLSGIEGGSETSAAFSCAPPDVICMLRVPA